MFTPQQSDILRAVMDRILPPDDFPGACEAGVVDYLHRQFERDLKDEIASYYIGLDAIDAEACAQAATGFAAMSAEAQDALLSQIEHGNITTEWPIDPAGFFRMLVHHAAEGYYSDPGNGGNRDGVSWQMIGYEVSG